MVEILIFYDTPALADPATSARGHYQFFMGGRAVVFVVNHAEVNFNNECLTGHRVTSKDSDAPRLFDFETS